MRTARLSPFICGSIIVLSAAAFFTATVAAQPQASQRAVPSTPADFEPLERWKEAVLAGDKNALRGFYVSGRPAFVNTPERTMADPAVEEPECWSSLVPQGLIAIAPKILEQTTPLGAVKLTLRIELTFRSGDSEHRQMISAEQIWTKQGSGDWQILITHRGDLEPLPTFRLPEPERPNPHLYPDTAEAQADLGVALVAARADGKRVLLIFGANWCYPCQVLGATLESGELAPLVAARYHVVHVNVGSGDSNTDLAKRFQVPVNEGIPSLAISDGDARLIATVTQQDFQSASEVGIDGIIQLLDLKATR